MPNTSRKLGLAVVLALAGSPAVAAPARTSVVVATTLLSAQLPMSTVSAAWSVDTDNSDRLHATGYNLPGTVSTVTASWSGTRHADSNGRLLRLDHLYVYDAVLAGATADISVDYELRGHWYRLVTWREDYVGSVDTVTLSSYGTLLVKAPAIAGRTVPVRISLAVRYPEPCLDIDDAFVVRAAAR